MIDWFVMSAVVMKFTDVLRLLPNVQEEVTRRFALLEEAVMRKSPSDLSCSSLDAFLPHRIKLSKDKDCISIHSERGIDTRRRFSIVNSQARKVITHLLYSSVQSVRPT